MFKRIMLGLVVLAIVAAAVHYVNKRYFTAEEEHVRAVIETVISHMESDNATWSVMRIRDQLSDKYRHYGEGSSRTVGKAFAVRFVTGLKHRYVGFEVEVHASSVSVAGDTAQVEMIGRVTAAPKSNPQKRVEVMTERGRNRVLIELAKEDGEWMIVGSQRLSHELGEASEED